MRIEFEGLLFDKEIAFRLVDCFPDQPLYEEMEELYEELCREFETRIKPYALMGFCEEQLYAVVICTLGEETDRFLSELFEKGEYVKGLLANAMADSCLFSLEEQWKKVLLLECEKKEWGIEERLEAPKDYPPELQRRIWELVEGEKHGIGMTKAGMFTPAKTCGFLFLLTEDKSVCRADHNCRDCDNPHCKIKFGC